MTKQPNILMLMMDQLAPQVLGAYGGKVCRTPNISRLADAGVVFENAYTNYPICAPARYALMSGQLPSKVGAYDNATEFPSEVPTFAHYLRDMGYHTCLSGKMHFVGADQLHGFEDRVTTDVYPSDFTWTTDWSLSAETWFPWYHSMRGVLDAGPWRRSVNTEYDAEVAGEAARWLHDHADTAGDKPFFLATSFISPHDPYLAPPRYWDMYSDDEIDDPIVGDIPVEERDPHSRRLYYTTGRHMDEVSPAAIRRMRRAYYAVMTWVDDRIGEVLDALEAIGEAENTIIVLTGDHGDFLGERGLFYKMSFHEFSARVPMIVSAPGRFKAGRVSANVSLVDLMPTFLEWGGNGTMPELHAAINGHGLNNLLEGDARGWPDTAYGEYAAEGSLWPLLMVRKGRYKYIYGEEDPPLLFDLEADPHEIINLAGDPDHAQAEAHLREAVFAQWDPKALRETIWQSQRRRLWLGKVLTTGKRTRWDWQPWRDAGKQYVRAVEDVQGIYSTEWSDQKR
jgi:choline-sulfatase